MLIQKYCKAVNFYHLYFISYNFNFADYIGKIKQVVKFNRLTVACIIIKYVYILKVNLLFPISKTEMNI